MPIDPTYVLYGVILFSVLLLVEGGYLFIGSTLAKRRANRRLSLPDAGLEPRELLNLLRRQPARETRGLGALVHPVDYLEGLISHSGVQTTPRRVFVIILGLAFVAVMGCLVAHALGRLPHLLTSLSLLIPLAIAAGGILVARGLPHLRLFA